MRILFDQGTPVPLREFLSQHEVATAYERGWSTLKNGELLEAAERDYGVVIRSTKRADEQVSLPRHFSIDEAATAALRGRRA